jgi:hypothetical protein
MPRGRRRLLALGGPVGAARAGRGGWPRRCIRTRATYGRPASSPRGSNDSRTVAWSARTATASPSARQGSPAATAPWWTLGRCRGRCSRWAASAPQHHRRAPSRQHQLAEILVERGGQELLRGAPSRALPYLVEALRRGLDTPALRALLADAARPLDSLEKSFEIGGGPWSVARFSPERAAAGDLGLRAVGHPVGGARGHAGGRARGARRAARPAGLARPTRALLLTATSCGRALDGCDRTLRVWGRRTRAPRRRRRPPEPVTRGLVGRRRHGARGDRRPRLGLGGTHRSPARHRRHAGRHPRPAGVGGGTV